MDTVYQDYWDHVSKEGVGSENEHPDGCYYCGSLMHHSQDCPHMSDACTGIV